MLIVTDLDGTILRSDASVSMRTLNALNKCRSRNIQIIFSTSRSLNLTTAVLEDFAPDYMICNGGSLVLKNDTVLYSAGFSCFETLKFVKFCKENQIKPIIIETDKACLTDDLDVLHWKGFDNAIYTDAFSIPFEKAYKINIKITNDMLIKKIVSNFSGIEITRLSSGSWYRISPCNINKQTALKKLVSRIDVNKFSIVGFGDGIDDLGFLLWVGIGVAMGNSHPLLLTSLDEITASNDEDGVAMWLEKKILG